MKTFLVFLFFLFSTQISIAQSQQSIDYIDNQNRNEQNPQLYSHLNNNYLISSTETSQFSNEYILSISKTTKLGSLLWTNYYRPGSNSYTNFTTNKVQFKDSVILIYGICRDEINRVRKFFFVLNLEGMELNAKIFPFTTSVIQFHASLSDSNTIECVHFDYEPSRLIHYEQYNKNFKLIHSDSLANDLKTTNFRAYNSSVYALELHENTSNKLAVKLFHFNKNFELIDSSIFNTDIPIYPTAFKTYGYANVSISLDSNVLFIEGLFDFNAIDLDSYFLRINLQSKQLVEHYYSKRNNNVNYKVEPDNTKYIRFKGSIYCLQKISVRDSTIKTIVLLSKINNGNLAWSKAVYQSEDPIDSNEIRTISLDTSANKILTNMSFVQGQKLWIKVFIKYEDGTHHWDFSEPIDTFSEPISIIKTIYSHYLVISTFATTRFKNTSDIDLLWKVWNLDILGSTNSRLASRINIYPNPANEKVTISGLEIPDGTLECTDVLGIKYNVNIVNNKINTSNLYPGLYFIYFKDKNMKFIKSNY